MTDLELKILQSIEVKPGQTARQIAANLGVDKRSVNSLLYGSLRGKVQQDNASRWYLRGKADIGQRPAKGPTQLDTALAKLCRYYLDCLSHDDLQGISEFASSYGQPKYVELPALPMFNEDGSNPFDSEGARQFLARVRRERNPQAIFLGYPVRLNFIRSRRTNWEGFMVEPILLFPFQEADSRHDTPVLGDDLPQINFKALRSLSNASENLMEEAIQFAEELGLGNTAGDLPDLDDLLLRMPIIRPEWDWRENIDPYALSCGEPLAAINQQGVCNRAILVSTERSPYTQGLETELRMLQAVAEPTYRETALGAWLMDQTIDSPPTDQQPLLEVLPLNSEQRQAVRQALVNPLTVITGPPGTGKSQVVTSILVNAAWQGKTVLFASKNNKAVDVVETRVNALGPRPVLLRLGAANEYQARLADYLVNLLAAVRTEDDEQRYRECSGAHDHLRHRSDALDAELQVVVQLRNDVDALEQDVEQVRRNMGEEAFRRARSIDHEKLTRSAALVHGAIDQANRAKQDFLTRLLWVFLRSGRFERVSAALESFRDASRDLGVPTPDGATDSSSVRECIGYGQRLAARISEVAEAQEYFIKLASLTKARSLEELSRLRTALTNDLGMNSEALWCAWLRLQPARMSPEQRKLLGDYSALLQMLVAANNENRLLGRDIYRRYYQLFPQVMQVLPCWAVTSLSARGRIPLQPNFFDLLVVDEASQCDIASALPLLYRARRVVVIGDPKQLRHISTLSKQQDQQLLSEHALVDEFAGWAYSTRSLFDLASSRGRSEDIVALRDHHRSHSQIIEFSNETFYDGRLRVATAYDRLRRPRQDEVAVRWVDVQGRVVRPASGGAVNELEARRVVVEIERLVNQGYRGSIGVVSAFRAQANRIRDLVSQNQGLNARLVNDFLVDTVHKFQGDERDVMFFSPVVSAGVPDSALGFLRSTPNLFNVAVTRARAALIVVGDHSAALNCHVDYLSKFASYVDRLQDACRPMEMQTNADLGPEYPAVSQPELVSEWERLFYRAAYVAGIRPIPQYPVEKYLLDFALVADDRRLNIEIDGERYHRNWDGELCRRDQIRNQRLLELGWDVIRFWVYQVRDDLDQCVERIRRWMNDEK